MGFIHKKVLRPLLFRQDSERAHNAVVQQLALVSRDELLLGCVKKIFGTGVADESFWFEFPQSRWPRGGHG